MACASNGNVLPQLKVFISYGWNDAKEAADALFSLCNKEGHEVWLDRDKLQLGDGLRQSLKDAIDRADVVLALLTRASYNSANCQMERDYAAIKSKLIIPVVLESQPEIPFELGDVLWTLFPRDQTQLLNRLACLTSLITPNQLGPGLSRFDPSAFSSLPATSNILSGRAIASELLQLIGEINSLAEILAPLNVAAHPKQRSNEGILALKFIRGLVMRSATRSRLTDRDVLILIRKLHLDSEIIDGSTVRDILERSQAPLRRINEDRAFIERPDILFGNSGLNVVYSLLTLDPS